MNLHCIDEWSLQGYDILMHELSKSIDRAILRRVAQFCTITQTVTFDVATFSLPAGHCNRFSAKLDFEPKVGDVIAFGDRPACYTIIELPYANGINPWIIVLDRSLDEPVRTDFIGFVTQPIRRHTIVAHCGGVVPGVSGGRIA